MISDNFTIIGGGLVGLATAWRILQRSPQTKVVLLEKEAGVGRHQSTHNSGVLHCGLHYRPGSHKARLAVAGVRQMVQFCWENGVGHDVCGKLVVATTEEQVARLKTLQERGTKNGLTGLRWLEPAEFRKIEPHAAGLAALHVPEEGIADYAGVVAALARRIQEMGGTIETNAKVTALARREGEWHLQTPRGEFTSKFIVNCAGLHSDRVCRRAGERPALWTVGFRGEYYRLKRERQDLVRNLIYPVPDPQFPFLGVHFTRLMRGGVEAGPNAVLAFSREGYRFRDVNVRDLAGFLAFPGLWRFLWKHRRMCAFEFAQSLSKERFCRTLQRLVPELRPDDLETGGSGVRAQAMSPEGALVEDFNFVRAEGALHVLNAPSPAATSSLAIGEHIAGMLA
ncbi:MAG TPA: L-2-hydroxyglutarate oxidase [Opitutaceae bacterium]|nr:L-2-hydroxyglutarate oxidase [Opitutaceae bacterium]